MKKQNEHTKSSRNVFKDLNVTDAELNLLKADLAIAILNTIEEVAFIENANMDFRSFRSIPCN